MTAPPSRTSVAESCGRQGSGECSAGAWSPPNNMYYSTCSTMATVLAASVRFNTLTSERPVPAIRQPQRWMPPSTLRPSRLGAAWAPPRVRRGVASQAADQGAEQSKPGTGAAGHRGP